MTDSFLSCNSFATASGRIQHIGNRVVWGARQQDNVRAQLKARKSDMSATSEALPLLALSGFVAVCGTVVYSVAAPALVPSLVSPQSLPAANSRIELARTVAFASGPALGGVLVGWVGAAPAFGFAAALSIIAVVLLSGIYEPTRQPAPQRHPMQEIREGAAFVLHHPLLRPVFITQFIFNTASFLLLAGVVPYAVRRLGLSATGVGTTLAMYGVGMVIGALLATRVISRLPFGVVIGLGP